MKQKTTCWWWSGGMWDGWGRGLDKNMINKNNMLVTKYSWRPHN